MKNGFVILAVIVCLSGCKSTGVVPLGQDTYFIGKKDGSPGIGISLSNKAAVYKEANEFCNSKGLELLVVKEKVISAVPARLGSTELNFRCVSTGYKEGLDVN
jgi:hypothetical protein